MRRICLTGQQLRTKKMKRYLVYPFDFDTRAELLRTEIQDSWEEKIKAQWRTNRESLEASLRKELGDHNFDMKLKNVRDCGSAPFSIVSYHNPLYHQARYAFYHGYYYPALLAACALGERMLNHMILDLRDEFSGTEQYRKVARKNSFDNWDVAISTLEAWDIFQADCVTADFRALKRLRHRSVHFSPETYRTLREDALSALQHLASIIRVQFGFDGAARWMLPGTKGNRFIKKDSEADPFLVKYYLPQCPLVSPMFSINFLPQGIGFFDFKDTEDREVSDAEFARLYNERDPTLIAPSKVPPEDNIVWYLRQ